MVIFYILQQIKMSKCLSSGLRGRVLLFLLLPDVSSASVAGIFRGLAPVLLLGVY